MKIEYYESTHGWSWNLRAKNGSVLAASVQHYSNRGNVKRACAKVAALMKQGSVVIVEVA